MRHPQTVALLVIALGAAFGFLLWSNMLWSALGVLVGGLVLLYVVVLAWVRAPRSGVRRDKLSEDDSFSELR